MDSSIKKERLSFGRNSNKDRWTDEKTKKFITLYINLPVLWDVSNDTYNQRAKKVEAFNKLQKEFDLSLIEVRNKIRIYRTTYGQELKKLQSNPDYQPKLAWFHTLHEAFSSGRIKSFVKTPKKQKSGMKIEIQYEDEDEEAPNDSMTDENMSETQYEIKEVKNINDTSTLIFTEYEEQYEPVEEPQQVQQSTNHHHQEIEVHNEPTVNKSTSSLSSNQLFLNSLLSTFEKLPDDKNMKARIKIQEVLYKIAYDLD